MQQNLTMCLDLYELTMAQVYFDNNLNLEVEAVFDYFYRRNPDDAGYSIFAGLEQFIKYVEDLNFSEEEIIYLRSLNKFSESFLAYLAQFKFSGEIYALKEGSVMFPNEPIVRVKAKIIEAQIIETALLLTLNHQSLIATKANRIVKAANGAQVLELGARRAHNFDAANYGARASYIGGVDASATLYAGMHFDLPVVGTMAHSFVQSFASEYEAFKTYAKTYPENTLLLLDTYNTIDSGLVNAIRVHYDVLVPMGYRLKGLRIDSGDIAALSKKIRKILDAEGLEDVKIVASNSFDEHLINSLNSQNAKIDIYGVGENLVTSKSTPVFGGVYKLAALLKDNEETPKIKISENIVKLTNPGYKKLYRFYDNENKALVDYICRYDEVIDPSQDIKICHPVNAWEYKILKANTYQVEELLVPIFKDGKLVYDLPTLEEIRAHREYSLNTIRDEVKRFEYPQTYYVDLSEKLFKLKTQMLEENAKR